MYRFGSITPTFLYFYWNYIRLLKNTFWPTLVRTLPSFAPSSILHALIYCTPSNHPPCPHLLLHTTLSVLIYSFILPFLPSFTTSYYPPCPHFLYTLHTYPPCPHLLYSFIIPSQCSCVPSKYPLFICFCTILSPNFHSILHFKGPVTPDYIGLVLVVIVG